MVPVFGIDIAIKHNADRVKKAQERGTEALARRTLVLGLAEAGNFIQK